MTEHDLRLIEIGEKHGAANERAAIVAWLRAYECSYYIPSHIQEPFDEAADAIEQGEHWNDR